MKMNKVSSFLFPSCRPALRVMLALTFVFSASLASAKVHLKIAATRPAIERFGNWTAGTSWEQISNFKNPNAERLALELILQLQALKAGNLDFDFELVPFANSELAMREVIAGRADLGSGTIEDTKIAEHASSLLKTEAILKNYEQGIYVLPTNEKILKITSLEELRPFVAVTVSTWALDVKALEDMKIKEIVKVGHRDAIHMQFKNQKADFILEQFSSKPDMSNEYYGVKLVPVPNCKVTFDVSRSWIISKNSPVAPEISAALSAGIKVLHDKGTIQRAYIESGFYNARVANWKRLN